MSDKQVHAIAFAVIAVAFYGAAAFEIYLLYKAGYHGWMTVAIIILLTTTPRTNNDN